MRFRRALLAAACLAPIGAGTAAAQAAGQIEGTVRGTVVDSATGAPVARVRVETVVGHHRAETDAAGGFALPAASTDTLTVYAIGYRQVRLAVTPGETAFRISLATAPAVLPDLVVTASRRLQRAAEVAIPVTTVDTNEIRAVAAASVDRIVGELPGVQILPNAPTGADISIRGMDGPRVLVMIDGQPIAGDLLENRDLSRLSTLAVERIEVVKGPLSALYGTDALGGVVNVITKDPAGQLRFDAEARVGDLGRREASIAAAQGGKFAYRLNAGWRQLDQVASLGANSNLLDRVWDFRSTVRYEASPTFRLRADASYLRERQRWPVDVNFNGFNDNRGFTAWTEASLDRGRGNWRVRVFGEDYTHRFRQAEAEQPIASDTTPAQTERMGKTTLAYAARLGTHTLDVGVDVGHRWIESPGKVEGDRQSDNLVEGYAQDGWVIGRVLLTPAARLSSDSRWGTAFTPSFAAAWDATPQVRLRASIARGFRAPSFKELAWTFNNFGAGYEIRGNPDLKPESSWQTSVGGSWSFARGFLAEADAYRNNVNDLIDFVAINEPGDPLVYSMRNLSRARTQGIELALKWTADGWLASLGYNYLDAKDLSTDSTLVRRAKHSGRARLGREWRQLGGIRADASVAYTGSAPLGETDTEGNSKLHSLVATSFQLQLGTRSPIAFSLGVDNAFDAKPAGYENTIVGRRFYAGIKTSLTP